MLHLMEGGHVRLHNILLTKLKYLQSSSTTTAQLKHFKLYRNYTVELFEDLNIN